MSSVSNCEEYVIQTPLGLVAGTKSSLSNGRIYYSFKGIPYAKPPIGNLRFKAPLPVERWEGIRDCTRDAPQCYSRNVITREADGSEDCLYLNVFSPAALFPTSDQESANNVASSLLPVMFWIHGGGFSSGSNNSLIYGPQFLLEEADIILVTINYRLGVLGFLSLEDAELRVPGNAGLKDMVMALRWVHSNIRAFNGDARNVTLFGESAGAAAVHLLMLSPMAQGLFHRAIAQSGSALNTWVSGRKCGKDLAKHLPEISHTTNERNILKLLQQLPVETLFSVAEKLPNILVVNKVRSFGVVIESASKYEQLFLPEHPIDIIKSGRYAKVPFLVGYTNREGMLMETVGGKDFRYRVLSDFERCVPNFLKLEPGTNLSKFVAERIKHFYYGSDYHYDYNSDIDRYYIMQSDNFFIREIYNTVRFHRRTSSVPIYLYRMSVETALNVYKHVNQIKEPGVCHADDVTYLFKTAFTPELAPGSKEYVAVKRFVRYWTNFAKTGDPNPKYLDSVLPVKWPVIQYPDQIHFLDIGSELTTNTNPEPERMKFWDDILDINPVHCKL